MALLPVGIVIGILVLLVPGFLWLCRRKTGSRKPLIWLLLFFCCAFGFLRMGDYQRAEPGKKALLMTRGKPVTVCGDVSGITEKENSCGLTLTDCCLMWQEETYDMPDMVVYVEPGTESWGSGEAQLHLGMRVSVRGKPERPTEARNPGEFDFREYYRAQGIFYQMFGKDMEILDGTYWRYRDMLYRIRLGAGDVLEKICEPQDLGILKAAILGDKTSMDETVRDLYQRNGIAHLLAISGLHISMVGLGLYRILRRVGFGYGGAGILGTSAIVSYGILTGASSSVQRAVIMVLVFILAEYLGRCYDMLSAAGLACILLLWNHPGLLTQAGFQLSFGAVAAIGLLGPWLEKRLEMKSGWGKTAVLGASVQMVTAPVILYHFYQYPAYGIVLNLLVIPLMAYVILSGLAGIFLGVVWLPAGTAAIGSSHYILALYLWLCERCGGLPGANLVAGKPAVWQIGMYGISLAGILWLVCGRAGIGKIKQVILLSAGAVLCFLFLWQLPVKGMWVTFLDVGQGDGICIRTRDAVILVDGGSSDKKELGKNTMEPYLKSLGICEVDYAVVSHGDKDHISGLQYLLEESRDIRIHHLILPWLGREDESYKPLVTLMESHGGQVHWMKKGERILAGGMTVTCLYHGREEMKKERNEHSLVLRLDYGQTGILFTGDMSSEGEADMMMDMKSGVWPSEDKFHVLKAAHHGSKYSSSEAFLAWTEPELAVISCGEGNSYGHPHEEMLERLKKEGAEILITEDGGAVMIHTAGGVLSVRTFLPENTG